MSTIDTTPDYAAVGAALIGEGERLRDRATLARQASAALALAVTAQCAASAATCAGTQHLRTQWRCWRRGLATLRRCTAGAPRSVLRVCMECEAVCFPPAAGDGTPETWVMPPTLIREHFRAGWRGPALSHGVCPGCAPRLKAALERELAAADSAASAADQGVSRHSQADMLFAALAEVEAATAALVARAPGVDGRAALDRALALVVERLTARMPPDDMRALAAMLGALLPRPHPGSAPPDQRPARAAGAVRLRPPLRHP